MLKVYDMLHVHVTIGKVKDITKKEHFARDMTGLLEAREGFQEV